MRLEEMTSEVLFERLLTNKTQKSYWRLVSELRKRPNQDVFNQAFNLANSNQDKQVKIGLDVLQQLGFNPRFNQSKTLDLHFKLLNTSQSIKVLKSILYGIGHNNQELNSEQVNQLIPFRKSKSIQVRQALVSALSGVEEEVAIQTLIELTEDKVASIRNWATFAIGSLISIESPSIKQALWKRVNDEDYDTKWEAIMGLANRKENGVKQVISDELNRREYGTLMFEAILKLNNKTFIPSLKHVLLLEKKDGQSAWIPEIENTLEELMSSNF